MHGRQARRDHLGKELHRPFACPADFMPRVRLDDEFPRGTGLGIHRHDPPDALAAELQVLSAEEKKARHARVAAGARWVK